MKRILMHEKETISSEGSSSGRGLAVQGLAGSVAGEKERSGEAVGEGLAGGMCLNCAENQLFLCLHPPSLEGHPSSVNLSTNIYGAPAVCLALLQGW